MPKRPVHSVYFTKLVLENIRSFSERQELKLIDADNRPARWTLLVGDNGVGKATLLQCLARMRPVFNRPPDDNSGLTPNQDPVEPELAGEEDNDVLDTLARSVTNTEARQKHSFRSGCHWQDGEHRAAGPFAHGLASLAPRADSQVLIAVEHHRLMLKNPLF